MMTKTKKIKRMKKTKHIFPIIFPACFIIVCLAVLPLQAQHNTISSVLTKCMNYYSSHPNLSFDMYYKMYDSHTSSKLIHNIDGSIKTYDGNVFIKMGGQTQVLTSGYAIVTDDATKTMVVQERANNPKKNTPLGIDSLVGMFGETFVVKQTDEVITLAFNKPKATFYTVNKFTVDIDIVTGRVIGAVLFYAFDLNEFYDDYNTSTVPRIEIIYDNYNETNFYTSDIFSSANFFNLQSEKITPVKDYKDYRLVDLRNLNKK